MRYSSAVPTPQASDLLSPCVLVVKTPVASRKGMAGRLAQQRAAPRRAGGGRGARAGAHPGRRARSLAPPGRRAHHPLDRRPGRPGAPRYHRGSFRDHGRGGRHPSRRLALGDRGGPARRQLRAAVERGLSHAHPPGDRGARPGADRQGGPAAAAGLPRRGRARRQAASSGAQRRPRRARATGGDQPLPVAPRPPSGGASEPPGCGWRRRPARRRGSAPRAASRCPSASTGSSSAPASSTA